MTIPNMNLSEAKRESVEPGGYIVKVIGTNIDTQYNRLQLDVDIVEGKYKGYFTRLQERANFWGLTANLYMNKEDAWKFANAVDAFRKSNAGFEWEDDAENDERKMVGMIVGAITQKRHYIGNDGVKKSKLLVNRLVPVEEIRSGDFEIPEDLFSDDYPKPQQAPTGKVVDTTAEPPEGFSEVKDEDMPF